MVLRWPERPVRHDRLHFRLEINRKPPILDHFMLFHAVFSSQIRFSSLFRQESSVASLAATSDVSWSETCT